MKNKKFILYIGIIILMVMFVGCNSMKTVENSAIKIISGNEKLNVFEDKDFADVVNDADVNSLVYIKNGEEISITFENKVPEELVITEHILGTKGEYKYATETTGKNVEFDWNDRSAVFKVEPNFTTALSSLLEDYLPGNVIKGYRLSIKDGETTKEYCFVIRGDAAV